MTGTGTRAGDVPADDLDAMLRDALAPARDRARFLADLRAELVRRTGGGPSDPADPATPGSGGSAPGADRSDDGTTRARPRWMRAAASVVPPGLFELGIPKALGAQLTWKSAPLVILALPIAALLGVVVTAWWALRAVATPDATRARVARSRLERQLQWWMRDHGLRLAALFASVALLLALRATESVPVLAASLIVFYGLSIQSLVREGRATRLTVGRMCCGMLFWASLQVAQIGPLTLPVELRAGFEGFGALILMSTALFCGLAAIDFDLRRLGHTLAGGGRSGPRLGRGERILVAVLLTPAALAVLAAIVLPVALGFGRRPILDRLQDEVGFELRDDDGGRSARRLAEIVASAPHDRNVAAVRARFVAERDQKYASAAPLWDAAFLGLVGPGELDRHRRDDLERLLTGDQPLPPFVLHEPAVIAFALSPQVSDADRLHAARRLAEAIPQRLRFGALDDARKLGWLCCSLGHGETILARSDAIRALLVAHWLPALQDGAEPGFTNGVQRGDGGYFARSEDANLKAALLMDDFGVPSGIDVAAMIPALRRAAAEGERFDRPADHHAEAAAAAALLAGHLPTQRFAALRWLAERRFLLALLVLAAFCVVVTMRAPRAPRVHLAGRPTTEGPTSRTPGDTSAQ
ncbi:MAG: hypothetical protein IPM29_01690 [Planctomycetes bacterium]|nr:hypothetical protein [Planctomycetota bacterium]